MGRRVFEVGVSLRLRVSDTEYLAIKAHEILKEMGSSELDTVYFSEVVGNVGDVSVALYLSRSNVGVLTVAASCEDEKGCIVRSIKEVVSVLKRVVKTLGNLVSVVQVEHIVKTRVGSVVPSRDVLKLLKLSGVEVSEGNSYEAGWYRVKTLRGKYISSSMRRLDVTVTLVYEKSGEFLGAQLTVSRVSEVDREISESDLVECLKATSQVIAYITT